MLKKDRFFLRCWMVVLTVFAMLFQFGYLTDRSKMVPFSLYPYWAILDVFFVVVSSWAIIRGAIMFWRLLNERVKDAKHTDG